FIISPSGSYSPVIGWGVQIFETDGSRVWIGTIQKWGVRCIGNDGWRVITLTCVGLMKVLDGTQLESKKFANATAATIIADQFTLVPTSPLTLGTISTGATVVDIDVAGSFKDLLDKLALLSGYV